MLEMLEGRAPPTPAWEMVGGGSALNCVSPKCTCGSPDPSVMVPGGGARGNRVVLGEVTSVGSLGGIGAFIGRDSRALSLPLPPLPPTPWPPPAPAMRGHTEKVPSESWEVGLSRNPTS